MQIMSTLLTSWVKPDLFYYAEKFQNTNANIDLVMKFCLSIQG
jgi:hypothetical protein